MIIRVFRDSLVVIIIRDEFRTTIMTSEETNIYFVFPQVLHFVIILFVTFQIFKVRKSVEKETKTPLAKIKRRFFHYTNSMI